MLMIVAHHFAVHGGFDFSNSVVTVNRLWIQFIQIGGKIGVNIFVLISGYFLVSAKSVKINKLIKLWLQIFTYSVIIFAVFMLCGMEPFRKKELIKHCFPVTFQQWWFASTYFVLYLMSPYINKLLNAFDKKQYQHFLLLLGVCWCIIPTFSGQPFQSNSLSWFIFLYAFAGYVRLFEPKIDIKGTVYILSAVAFIILTFLITVVFDFLGTKIAFFGSHATFFYDMQRLPIFLISVMMFVGFLKTDIGYKPVINIISSATFGVYLIHDNEYVRSFLWQTVFDNASYTESPVLILYSVLAIMLVFIGCTVIELVRINFLEKNYVQTIDLAVKKINMKIGRI